MLETVIQEQGASTNLEGEVYIIGENTIGEIPNSGASILISSGEESEDRLKHRPLVILNLECRGMEASLQDRKE